MDRSSFGHRLVRASESCRHVTFECVWDVLPEGFRYFVRLNSSYDGNPLREGEVIFPDDVANHGGCVGPLGADEVVSLLWRDHRVPEWVDISVWGTDEQNTYFELLSCGRFTDREELLYYTCDTWQGSPVAPFGIKGPHIPGRLWYAALDGEKIEKFSLAESRPDFPLRQASGRPSI